MMPVAYKLSYEEHESLHDSRLEKLAEEYPDLADEDEHPKQKLEKVKNMMLTYADQSEDAMLEELSIETRIMAWRNDNPELAKKGWLEIPPEGDHDTTLFILHGLSGVGQEYKELGKRLLLLLPYETRAGLKIICPTAATRCIFGEYYPAWFTYETDMSGQIEEDVITEQTLYEAREELGKLLDNEFELVSNVFVLGVSQGGSMAVDLCLNYTTNPILGAVGSRCVVMTPSLESVEFDVEEGLPTPLLLTNGGSDNVFVPKLVKNLAKRVPDAKQVFIKDMDHYKPNLEEEVVIANWILEVLQRAYEEEGEEEASVAPESPVAAAGEAEAEAGKITGGRETSSKETGGKEC